MNGQSSIPCPLMGEEGTYLVEDTATSSWDPTSQMWSSQVLQVFLSRLLEHTDSRFTAIALATDHNPCPSMTNLKSNRPSKSVKNRCSIKGLG